MEGSVIRLFDLFMFSTSVMEIFRIYFDSFALFQDFEEKKCSLMAVRVW